MATFNEGDILDTLYPNSEGVIVVSPDEFGWEFDSYNDAETKLSYCALYARDWVGDDSSKYLEILTSVVREQVGDVQVQYPLDRDKHGYYENGYIDHQSVENRDLDYLFTDPEQLRQFIFNPKSVLETGNDNDPRDYEDDEDSE